MACPSFLWPENIKDISDRIDCYFFVFYFVDSNYSLIFVAKSSINQKIRQKMIGTPEIILIVLVVLLLWGGKKVPELMNGLGRGVKSFKDGMNGKDDTPAEEKKDEPKP